MELNFFSDLWQMAKQAGPFATCLLLVALFLVNRERREERSRNDALIDRTHKAMTDATEAIKDLRMMLMPTSSRKRGERDI